MVFDSFISDCLQISYCINPTIEQQQNLVGQASIMQMEQLLLEEPGGPSRGTKRGLSHRLPSQHSSTNRSSWHFSIPYLSCLFPPHQPLQMVIWLPIRTPSLWLECQIQSKQQSNSIIEISNALSTHTHTHTHFPLPPLIINHMPCANRRTSLPLKGTN